jgi:predicted aspartyl protease
MLPVLQIGSLEVKNVQAVVLDLPDTLQGKGLLGLNVLQRLDMEIDSQNGMLVLKQSRGRRGR